MKRIGIAVLGVVSVFGLGIGIGVGVGLSIVPSTLREADLPFEVPVSSRQFDGSQSLEVSVTPPRSFEIHSLVSGRITALAALPGATVKSGEELVQVDSRGIIALASKIPLWRVLERGDSGADVESLNAELRRLGFSSVPAGKQVSAETLDAVAEMRKAQTLSEIDPSFFAWIPGQEVRVESVTSSVGDFTNPGADLLTVSGGGGSAVLASQLPDDEPRDLVIADVRYSLEVSVEGVLGADTTTIVVNSSAFAQARSQHPDASEVTVNLQSVLRDSLSVYVVPPSAVFGNGAHRCVNVAGEPVSVQLVASELGQTFVTSDTPLSVVERAPASGMLCPSS